MTKSPSLPTSLAKGVETIRQVVKTLPSLPGVYRMINGRGEVIYVGKAKDLKKRVVSYTFGLKLPHRLQRMVSETISLEIVTTHTETEALLLESNLIKKLQPPYNILLKDDKSFPYILITQDHAYPRIDKHRGPYQQKGKYFGPFASVVAVEETMILLQKVFLLRNCSDRFFEKRSRPCLQYHIKRCSAPCVHKISQKDYTALVKEATAFLNGKTTTIQTYLADKMNEASVSLAYEEAAHYRDRLRLLTKIQAHQRINVAKIRDADVIAAVCEGGQTCVQIFFFRQGRNFGTASFFLAHTDGASLEGQISAFLTQFYQERSPAPVVLLSHKPTELPLIRKALQEQFGSRTSWEVPKTGTKRELVEHALTNAQGALSRKFAETATFEALLDQMAKTFQLSKRPERIEVYDNSHLQGSHPYGVMVVATPQGFEKKSYRKFMIRSPVPPQGGDDYAMIREVFHRRFAHAGEKDWILPDLVLVDGGAGQLNVALKVIQELDVDGITVVGIAKGPARNAGREKFFQAGRDSFTLPDNDPLLHFLQRLRDEAHRFAIGTHRTKRAKVLVHSRLDDIPGIGPARKKALLHHFGSARGVKAASLQDLQGISGINKFVAKKIYAYFHEK
ncbi:MAG: excinuclease subunit [Alphaproteobacteria bacterium]|jgi:excinuclease ABC subunit C|nr:excinuclease subunit [Alphaproteobacteria bacterium]